LILLSGFDNKCGCDFHVGWCMKLKEFDKNRFRISIS
jgi:hypothetical protein